MAKLNTATPGLHIELWRIAACASIRPIRWGIDMGGTGKKKELPVNRELPVENEKKASKIPAAPVEDDDREDGDFATPKRDRHGDDDEPL
jgi:hypothetical protein